MDHPEPRLVEVHGTVHKAIIHLSEHFEQSIRHATSQDSEVYRIDINCLLTQWLPVCPFKITIDAACV